MHEIPHWTKCTFPGCSTLVDPRRIAATGHGRCLKHGDAPKAYVVAPPFNKGGDQLITPQDIQFIGRK